MRRNLIVAIFIILNCFFSMALYSQQKDSIFLYNGQVLIGEIKGVKLGILTIDETDLRILSIKIYKIKYLVAESDTFRIETTHKKIYFSQLHRDKEGTIKVFNGGQAETINLQDISVVVPLAQGFLNRLDGTLGIGFSFTKSNSIGQFTANSTVYYAARKFEYQLNISGIASIDSGKFSRDNESVQLFSNYNITPTWFVAAQLNYQRNLELSINRRYQEMIGAGNKILMKKDYQLMAITGLSVGQEKSTSGNETIQFEIPIMFRFNFFKYQHNNIQITAFQTGYINLSDVGRFRYDGTISFSQEIIHNFNISLNFFSNYDNRPPDETSSKIDYGISTNNAYRF